MKDLAREALAEIRRDLEEGILPFCLNKGVDKEYGGYLTCFDEQGNPWKAIYHTGRAMLECKRRLEKIVAG